MGFVLRVSDLPPGSLHREILRDNMQDALNRLTLLVNGHDCEGQAPAHAFQSTMALPKASREVKRGLSLADVGTHPQPASAEQRKFIASHADSEKGKDSA